MSEAHDDQPREPKEDTLRETPVAKASHPSISAAPGDWAPPPRRGSSRGPAVREALGSVNVRTIEVKGPLAWVLAAVLLGLIGLMVAVTVTFAIGVGAAFVAGGAVAGALGLGAAGMRRLSAGRRAQLPPGGGDQ